MKRVLTSVFILLAVPFAALAAERSEITKNAISVPVLIQNSKEQVSVSIMRKSEFLTFITDEKLTFVPTQLKNGMSFETVVLDGKIYALFDNEQYLFIEQSNEWGESFLGNMTSNAVAGAVGAVIVAAVPGGAGVLLAVVAGAAAGAAVSELNKSEIITPGRNGRP